MTTFPYTPVGIKVADGERMRDGSPLHRGRHYNQIICQIISLGRAMAGQKRCVTWHTWVCVR